MNIIFEIPHVKLCVSEKNDILIIVEDVEVFHFIEDVLTEKYEVFNFGHSTERINNKTVYTIYFSKEVDIDYLLIALKGIDSKEIEYLYKLNND